MNFKTFYFKNKMLVWSLNLAWLMILIHEVCIINKVKFYMIRTKVNTKTPHRVPETRQMDNDKFSRLYSWTEILVL